MWRLVIFCPLGGRLSPLPRITSHVTSWEGLKLCFSAMFPKRLEALKWLKYPLSLERNKPPNTVEWDGEKAAASSLGWRGGQLIPCPLLVWGCFFSASSCWCKWDAGRAGVATFPSAWDGETQPPSQIQGVFKGIPKCSPMELGVAPQFYRWKARSCDLRGLRRAKQPGRADPRCGRD